MDGDRIAMSQRERDRLKVMSLVLEGKRLQKEAARLLKLSTRQIRRLQRRLESQGDGGIVHKLRGLPSNARWDPLERQKIIQAYRKEFTDFGPTLAAEKLAQRGLNVSHETLRTWLLAEGLWHPRRKRDQHRQRRQRRECRGELVQADGSHHDWLEGRGPRMVLVAMIDDATSQLTARFYPGETTEAYMDLLGRYLRKHGRMVAMYVDRDSIFRAEDKHPDDPRPTWTQFSRALGQLQIELILANSPQAKGRVERSFQTAQDRLVKELRIADARTIEQANDVLNKMYLPWFNRCCSVKPSSPNDAHRPLHPSMHLESILSPQVQRKVANDYTIRLDNHVYQLLPPALPGQRGGTVTIEHRLDGTLWMRFKKTYLAYHCLGPADRFPGGGPPPPPRFKPGTTPREPKQEGCAAGAAQPSTVRPASGRSGRTPAEPYPPKGPVTLSTARPYRPPPSHPWKRKAVTSILHK
jgi:transposase-like protein